MLQEVECPARTPYIYWNFVSPSGPLLQEDSDYIPLETLTCTGSCFEAAINGTTCLALIDISKAVKNPSAKISTLSGEYTIAFSIGWSMIAVQFNPLPFNLEILMIKIGEYEFIIDNLSRSSLNSYWYLKRMKMTYRTEWLFTKDIYRENRDLSTNHYFISQYVRPLDVIIVQETNVLSIYVDGNLEYRQNEYRNISVDDKIELHSSSEHFIVFVYNLGIWGNNTGESLLPEQRELWTNHVYKNDLFRSSPWRCYDSLCLDDRVCSGHGTCYNPDECDCEPCWLGNDCSIVDTSCYTNFTNNCTEYINMINKLEEELGVCTNETIILRNDEALCQSNLTISRNDELLCQDNLTECLNDQHDCYGILPSNDLVCSSHGICISKDTCICEDDYYGDQCQNYDNTCTGCEYKTKYIYYNFIEPDPITPWYQDDSDYGPLEPLSCDGSCSYQSSNGTKCLLIDSGSHAYRTISNKLRNIGNNNGSYSIEIALQWFTDGECAYEDWSSPIGSVIVGAWEIIINIDSRVLSPATTLWKISVFIEHSGILVTSEELYRFTQSCGTERFYALYSHLDTLNVEIEQSKLSSLVIINGIISATSIGYKALLPGIGSNDISMNTFTSIMTLETYVLALGVNNRTMIPKERELWKNHIQDPEIQVFAPWYCFDVECNDTKACTGHGICTNQDECCCDRCWLGSECSIVDTSCYANDTSNCTEYIKIINKLEKELDICTSETLYLREQYALCVNKSLELSRELNDTLDYLFICNKNLTDCLNKTHPCPTIQRSCYGVLNTSDKACSSHGLCIDQDLCDCSINYSGDDCNITTCFSISSLEPNVCSSRGECIDYNECDCLPEYYGNDCSKECNTTQNCTCPMTCFGVLATSGKVCNSHGNCIDQDTCQCDIDYWGPDCNITTCFGIPSDDSDVCSQNGICIDLNNCNCLPEYCGDDCYTSCNTTQINDTCPMTCYGIEFDVINVCSSHGDCIDQNYCYCDPGYEGYDCSTWMCYGIANDDIINVCTGHGFCLDIDDCTCYDDYIGINCNHTCPTPSEITCFEVLQHSDKVCSGHGICQYKDHCLCEDNYYEADCNVTYCYDVPSIDESVCSSNGKCIDLDDCDCEAGYCGNECSISCNRTTNITCPMTCYGIEYDVSSVCSSHGVCIDQDVCTCLPGYNDSDCKEWSCYGITNNDTTNVCSGHGYCKDIDTCLCKDDYIGDTCSLLCSNDTIITCYGVLQNDSKVCNSHGDCINQDTCTCYPGYSDSDCDEWDCYGINNHQPNVCGGHGFCQDIDICLCTGDYIGYDCSNVCPNGTADIQCWGIDQNHPLVCYGHGDCIDQNKCYCNQGYSGLQCNDWSCYGIDHLDNNVCSEHGVCVEPDECDCKCGYSDTPIGPCNYYCPLLCSIKR